MPGQGPQRFLPQVPFGLGLGPSRQLAASLPPQQQAVQVAGNLPAGTFTYQARARALLGRTGPTPHLPRFLGVAQVFRPNVYLRSQSPAYTARGRVKLAPAVVATPALPTARVFSQAAARALVGRTTPRAHLASLAPPVGPGARVLLQAVQRDHAFRGTPVCRAAKPVLSPSFLAPVPIVFSQATRRPYAGRSLPRPRLPAFLAPPLRVAAATITSQAGQRALTRRSAPAPQRAAPLVSSTPLASAYVLSQAQQGARLSGAILRAHVAPPLLSTFVAPVIRTPRVRVTAQSYGARTRRYVPALLASPPVVRAVLVSQAIPRAKATRDARRSLLAPPVVGQAVAVQAPAATALGFAPLPTIVGVPEATQLPVGSPIPQPDPPRGRYGRLTYGAGREPLVAWAHPPTALPLGKILAIPPDVDFENWDTDDEELLLALA